MSKKLRIWCDSGANIHSCYEQEMTLEQLDISEEEWQSMGEKEKDEIMKEIAFDRLDWGYEEID